MRVRYLKTFQKQVVLLHPGEKETAQGCTIVVADRTRPPRPI